MDQWNPITLFLIYYWNMPVAHHWLVDKSLIGLIRCYPREVQSCCSKSYCLHMCILSNVNVTWAVAHKFPLITFEADIYRYILRKDLTKIKVKKNSLWKQGTHTLTKLGLIESLHMQRCSLRGCIRLNPTPTPFSVDLSGIRFSK